LPMLKFLRSWNPPAPWNKISCLNLAAFGGPIEMVKWIYSQGCTLNDFHDATIRFIRRRGDEMTVWLHDLERENRLLLELKIMNK